MTQPWERDWGGRQHAPWERDWSGTTALSDPTRGDAFWYNAADTASFGFGDEGIAAIEGLGSMAGGGSFSETYHRRVEEARSRLRRARELHPVSSAFGMIAGAAPSMLLTGGLSGAARAGQLGARAAEFATTNPLLRAAAGRGMGALMAQSSLGALGGAVGGGIYGAGAADDGDRAQGALQGAESGAFFGAVTPPVFQGVGSRYAALRAPAGAAIGATGAMMAGRDPIQGAMLGAVGGVAGRPIVRPVARAVGEMWSNPRAAFGSSTPMSLGIPVSGGGGPRAPRLDESAVRSVDRAMGRGRLDARGLTESVEAARADARGDLRARREPIDRRLADLHDEFSADTDALANMPGETFTRAQDVRKSRVNKLPEQLQSELRSMLDVEMTPGQARRAIRDAEETASTGYEDVLSNPAPDVMMRRRRTIEDRINPLMEGDYNFQEALTRLQRYTETNNRLARLDGHALEESGVRVNPETGKLELAPNATARQLHLLKVAYDDAIDAGGRRVDETSIGKFERGQVNQVRERFMDALDTAIPGYKQVRAQRGGLYEANDALEEGAGLLRKRPEEIEEIMADATPFQRKHYQIAAADELLAKIDDYVSARGDKTRNAAEVLDRVGLHKRIRAIFGDTPEVERFLNRAMERGENAARAISWTGNSATARRLSRGGDRFLAAMSALSRAARGDVGGAAGEGGGQAFRALMGRHLERQNNAFGDLLLRDLADPQNRAVLDELMRELTRIEEGRVARARAAAVEGAQGAIGGGNADDQAY